jgi:predicted permease
MAMNAFMQDLKYAIRMLAKSPGFAAVAILTLALGIGANTALFSVVNGVLLNPLPFPQPDQLYAVYGTASASGETSVSYLNFLDWQKRNRSFSGLSAYMDQDYILTGTGQPERIQGYRISAEFFPVAGMQPILGRNFRPEEDQAGAAPVVVIGAGLWKRKYGSSPDVIGKTMTLDSTVYTIIGVYADRLPMFRPLDAYVPMGQWNDPTFRDRRIGLGMSAIGRLKSGVTLAQARADMDVVAAGLAAQYPEADKGSGIELVPLKKDIVGDVQGILLVLLGAVGFVLLIACVNMANLLLARSTGRAREFAIRAALGASRTRVIRQLLTESILLATAGGALGLALANWGTQVVLAVLPEAIPRADQIGLDVHVLLFTLGISCLTGILFGLVPALKIARPDLQETLKEGGRGSSGTRHRTQRVLVAVEMAMALVLLVGAGLMIRSIAALWRVNPGFDPHNVLDFSTSFVSQNAMSASQLRAKYREILQSFEAIPGTEAVSMQGGEMPMSGEAELPFWIDGQPKPANDNEMPNSLFYLVNSGYQTAMRIPIIRGRFLSDQDDEHAPAAVVIDENFAKKYFPHQDPVGKRLNLELVDLHPVIVGVAGHVEHWGLGDAGHSNLQCEMYLSVWQLRDQFWPLLASGTQYAVRTKAEPLGMTNAFRSAMEKIDSTSVVYRVRTMDSIVASSIATKRFSMLLLSVFAALALLLSAVGIYGVISYLVGQRVHEIGIRMALGAQQRDVLRLVIGEGARMALIGIAAGLVAAVAMTRLMANMLYGVTTHDPLTFFGVTIVLAGVALAACYIPARRAIRVDPIVALRYE